MKFWQELRAIPRAKVAQVLVPHAVLVGVIWAKDLPYVATQIILAAEIVLVSVLTAPLYPQRGLLRHLGDTLKLLAMSAFLLFFIVVTYGVAVGGEDGRALDIGLDAAARVTEPASLWMLAYVVVHVLGSLLLAFSTQDPRATWVSTMVADNAGSFLAFFGMVFLAFAGGMLVHGLRRIGLEVSVDAVLGTLMVLLRVFLALIVATFSNEEHAALARDPYAP